MMLFLVNTCLGVEQTEPQTRDNAQCSEAVEVTKDMTPPTLVSKAEPIYPKALLAKKHSRTTVWVEAVITTDGSTACAKMLKSEDPEMGKAVLDAISKYKYNPALKDGLPVPVRFTIMIRLSVR